MKDFKKYFLVNKQEIKFETFDYLTNFKNFLNMNFNYLRHKIYQHYYRFIEKIFFKKNI